MKHLFSGGVHPADKKELTCDKEIQVIQPPKYVIIPMQQHIGAPCQPLVAVGDHVCMGQKIGEGEGLCVPVHASVSGTVTSVGPMPHPNGGTVTAVTIENDFQDTKYDAEASNISADQLTAKELFRMIREAGIVGMGGATFSTEIKAASSQNKIDTLIINACECEPYITADDALIRTQPKRILSGVQALARVLEPEKVIIAIEDNKQTAIRTLEQSLTEDSEIRLQTLPTRYPQGAEKQLIRAVTGREVPAGKLPADVQCAVFNVSTAAAVGQAIYEGEPLIQRIVTVTGEGIRNPQNFLVRIGTPFSVLIDAAGGLSEDADRVIAGGPMMGKAQSDLDVPVIKGTGSILCLKEQPKYEDPMCIRCGKCIEACPMYLQPLYLYRYEAAGDMKMLDQFHLTDCMECGCCAYVCPGRLPLVEHFRAGKRALKEGKA